MKTRTNESKTARETYIERYEDIQALIRILQNELESHKEHAGEDPKNWGFAGDLGHVRAQLKDAVISIGGYEDDDLESMLR